MLIAFGYPYLHLVIAQKLIQIASKSIDPPLIVTFIKKRANLKYCLYPDSSLNFKKNFECFPTIFKNLVNYLKYLLVPLIQPAKAHLLLVGFLPIHVFKASFYI